MPDLDLNSRDGRELVRLVKNDCRVPHRWNQANQDLFLWQRLLDRQASWQTDALLADYDRFIDERIVQYRQVSSMDLQDRLRFGQERLDHLEAWTREQAAVAA